MKGIVVFDIDDTLLTADNSKIGIWKIVNGNRTRLSTTELAADPDSVNPNVIYDYSEFRDKKKVYESIVNGKPIKKNINKLVKYYMSGYDICFLTARGLEETVYKSLKIFLNNHNARVRLSKKNCHAVNDETKAYKTITTPERKAEVLIGLKKTYKEVIFIDDDEKNLASASKIGIKVLKA